MTDEPVQTIDIVKVILETANSLCNSLLSSMNTNIFPLLDKVAFIDSTIIDDEFFMKIFGTSIKSGILMLANCILFAFVLYYCVRMFISHFSGNEVESPSRFLLRIILSALAMNISLELCKLFILGTEQITEFFSTLGYEIFGKQISFQGLSSYVTSYSNNNIFSLNGIISIMLSISSLGLLTSFAVRYIIIKLLVLAAPFAFLCISNKSTEPFFRSWYKSFISLLLMQIVLSVLLLFPYSLLENSSNSELNQILLIGSIAALLKSEQIVKELFNGAGISTDFQAGIAGLKSMFSR